MKNNDEYNSSGESTEQKSFWKTIIKIAGSIVAIIGFVGTCTSFLADSTSLLDRFGLWPNKAATELVSESDSTVVDAFNKENNADVSSEANSLLHEDGENVGTSTDSNESDVKKETVDKKETIDKENTNTEITNKENKDNNPVSSENTDTSTPTTEGMTVTSNLFTNGPLKLNCEPLWQIPCGADASDYCVMSNDGTVYYYDYSTTTLYTSTGYSTVVREVLQDNSSSSAYFDLAYDSVHDKLYLLYKQYILEVSPTLDLTLVMKCDNQYSTYTYSHATFMADGSLCDNLHYCVINPQNWTVTTQRNRQTSYRIIHDRFCQRSGSTIEFYDVAGTKIETIKISYQRGLETVTASLNYYLFADNGLYFCDSQNDSTIYYYDNVNEYAIPAYTCDSSFTGYILHSRSSKTGHCFVFEKNGWIYLAYADGYDPRVETQKKTELAENTIAAAFANGPLTLTLEPAWQIPCGADTSDYCVMSNDGTVYYYDYSTTTLYTSTGYSTVVRDVLQDTASSSAYFDLAYDSVHDKLYLLYKLYILEVSPTLDLTLVMKCDKQFTTSNYSHAAFMADGNLCDNLHYCVINPQNWTVTTQRNRQTNYRIIHDRFCQRSGSTIEFYDVAGTKIETIKISYQRGLETVTASLNYYLFADNGLYFCDSQNDSTIYYYNNVNEYAIPAYTCDSDIISYMLNSHSSKTGHCFVFEKNGWIYKAYVQQQVL